MKKILFTIPIIALLAASCNSSQQSTALPTQSKNQIAIGQPCDIHAMQPYADTITDTGGLQCYAYGPGSPNRNALWIEPNSLPYLFFQSSSSYDESEIPNIYKDMLIAASRNWKSYTSPDKTLSFKYPIQSWSLDTSLWTDSHILALREHDEGILITMQYYANSEFNSSADGQYINNNFPGGTDSLNNKLQDLVNFTLNKSQVTGFIQLPALNLGGSPNQVTLYIIPGNSFLKVTYSSYQNSDDFITEALLNTIQVK